MPAPHGRAKDRWRSPVERVSNKLKRRRRAAISYDKNTEAYPGFVKLVLVKF